MLIATLKENALAARVARDTVRATLLVTLCAEAAQVGKNNGNRDSTDEEVLTTIRKFLKNNSEAQAVVKDAARLDLLKEEAAILASYLPKMADEAEVRAYIAELVSTLPEKSPKAMGAIMGKLKAKFGANYDATKGSAWVKEALAT